MNLRTCSLFSALATALVVGASLGHADSLVYFGTFSSAPSGGIFASRLNSTAGSLSPAVLVAPINSPNFLALDRSNSRLYSIDETRSGRSTVGVVDSFRINRQDGRLTLINRQVTSGGPFAHLSLDGTNRFLAASRYNDGNAVILPLASDGQVRPVSSTVQHSGSGPNTSRQDRAHVHSVTFDPTNRFAFIADLGTDEITSYRFDSAAGRLSPNSPALVRVPPGSGPRHFAFHPSGKFAYAICELNATVVAYTYDSNRGSLTQTQISKLLPDSLAGVRGAAEVVVDSAGKFLYASNRGYDALVVYSIDQTTGQLTFVQREHNGLSVPRNFAIDPTGRWLLCANQNGNNVSVYSIDAVTGRLTRTGASIQLPQPVCVRFLPL